MDTETLYRTWGERIRAARRSKGDMSQADLARAVGTSQQAISQFEVGFRAPPDVLRLRIADALGVDVSDLFTYERQAVA